MNLSPDKTCADAFTKYPGPKTKAKGPKLIAESTLAFASWKATQNRPANLFRHGHQLVVAHRLRTRAQAGADGLDVVRGDFAGLVAP